MADGSEPEERRRRSFFSTEGRADRTDFLVATVLLVFAVALGLGLGQVDGVPIVTGLLSLAILAFGLTNFYVVGIRRCHDVGDSGVLLRIFFLPGLPVGLGLGVLLARSAHPGSLAAGLSEALMYALPFALMSVAIFLTIAPGNETANAYGPALHPKSGPDLAQVDENEPIEPVSEETAGAIRGLDDEELLRMAVHEPAGYERGAVEFARDEVARRGL